MIKREGYKLIGNAIASLGTSATKQEIVAVFIAALLRDRADFDAARFRSLCGPLGEPQAAISTPAPVVEATTLIDEPEDTTDYCDLCGEVDCLSGDCWSPEELKVRIAAWHARRRASQARP